MDFSRISFTCESYSSLSSTQIHGKEWHKLNPSSAPEVWHWIIATTQTEGYGTHQRHWASPEGGFYGTLCFHWPVCHKNLLPFLPLGTAYAVAVTMERIINDAIPPLQIKWINDVLWNGKKISGTLAETMGINQENTWIQCLVGIGINVNNIPHEQASYATTSLFHETKKKYDLFTIRVHLEKQLQETFGLLLTDIDAFLSLLHQRLLYYRDMAYLHHGSHIVHGRVLGVSYEGGIMMDLGPGIGIKRFLHGSLAKNPPSMSK